MKNGNRKSIYTLLRENPPDIQGLREELDIGDYTPEQVTKAAIQYLDDCFDDQVKEDYERDEWEKLNFWEQPAVVAVRPELRSAHIPEALKVLLEYGLDPNAVYDGENVMHSLKYIDNEYVAADTLALLFEHGGDCNMMFDGMELFIDLDHDVVFDAANQNDRRRYDALVHCWFVYLGYGAKLRNGASAVDTFCGFDISELKQHRNFTFALTYTPNRGETWCLHIIDRRNFWEVARL